MAKMTIEYGKKRSDDSMKVMIRLVSGTTQKRIDTHVELSKRDYKEDGKKIKIINDSKRYQVEDMMLDMTKKMNEFLREHIGRKYTADVIYDRISDRVVLSADDVDFFDFAYDFVEKNKKKTVKQYRSMLNHLVRYVGVKRLPFSAITLNFLNRYADTFDKSSRMYSSYLNMFKHIYKEACIRYNSDDFHPILSPILFDRFRVPHQVIKGQRALPLEQVRAFFRYEPKSNVEALVIDVCKLSFCLMGTNSVDLYHAEEYNNGILSYNRQKTKDRRVDNAHIEIVAHEYIKPLFDKYKSRENNHVFDFSSRYSTHSVFNYTINLYLKKIGISIGIDKLQFYQFRHSWASIARNDLRASAYDVDAALNHKSQTNALLDVYVKRDYTIINELNKRVIEYVFNLND